MFCGASTGAGTGHFWSDRLSGTGRTDGLDCLRVSTLCGTAVSGESCSCRDTPGTGTRHWLSAPFWSQSTDPRHLEKLACIYISFIWSLHWRRHGNLLTMEPRLMDKKGIFGSARLEADVARISRSLQMLCLDMVSQSLLLLRFVSTDCAAIRAGLCGRDVRLSLFSQCSVLGRLQQHTCESPLLICDS